jgi:tetratricopeptide (TPR) repeat protein
MEHMASMKKQESSGGAPLGMAMMRDVRKLLAQQDFKNEKEIHAFIERMRKEGLPEMPTTTADEAEDLVMEARSKPKAAALKLIRKALVLDPECIEAFELLGALEENDSIAAAYYNRGMVLGGERYMGEYRQENEGHFWGLTETRPLMRCMQHYANRMYELGRLDVSVMIWEQMLELNPNDNQGVRSDLGLFRASAGDVEGFAELERLYPDECCAASCFNRALFTFATKGAGPAATKVLNAAIAENEHVVPMLIAPEPPNELPYSYTLGSKEEAFVYGYRGYVTWMSTPDAVDWLKGELR